MGLKNKETLKTLMKQALQWAQGADYCDVRIVNLQYHYLSYLGGKLESDEINHDQGIAVRCLVNGLWGFSCTPLLTSAAVKTCVADSLQMAKESARVKSKPHTLAPKEVFKDFWIYPEQIPYNDHRKKDVQELLQECSHRMQLVSTDIKQARALFRYKKTHSCYMDSEGSEIEQIWMRTGAGLTALAVANGDMQTRTFRSRQAYNGGLEHIRPELYLQQAPRVAEEAIALTAAEEISPQKRDLIIGTNQLALQIHESVGHPNELDRVLGWEANFAGTSFNSLHNRKQLIYGSPIVNLVADNLLPGGTGTRAYDDEGVKAQRWDIVKAGVFQDYYTSRDTALHLGPEERSKGCCRADSWSSFPIIRIPNVSLQPQEGSLQELVASTEEGLYLDNNRSWSIDQRRDQFQFGVELAREIKNGALGKIYKNLVYRGHTLPFWQSCDRITGPEEYEVFGEIYCGKGQPMQTMEMSHGCAPARFRQIEVRSS